MTRRKNEYEYLKRKIEHSERVKRGLLSGLVTYVITLLTKILERLASDENLTEIIERILSNDYFLFSLIFICLFSAIIGGFVRNEK